MQSIEERLKFFSKDKFKKYGALLKEAIKAHPKLFTLFIVISILDTALFSGMSFIISSLVKSVTNTGGHFIFGLEVQWYHWVAIGCAMVVLYAIVDYLLNYTSGIFTRLTEIFVRVKCLKTLTDVDLSFYSKNQIGNIMTKIIGDSQGLADGMNEFLVNLCYIILMFILINVIMFSLDWKIALICLAIFSFLFIVAWTIFFRYQKALIRSIDFKQINDTNDVDRLMNIRLIKSSGTELSEYEKIKIQNSKYGQKINKTVWWSTIMIIFTNFFGWILPGIITLTIMFLYKDTMSVANISSLIISFISFISILTGAIFLLPIILRALSRTMNCNTRLVYIYSHKSLLQYVDNPKKINTIESIELKNLEFIYPEAPGKLIMPEINFKFEKGKSYAFVGETGSGKSTIAKLLLRFYDPSKGSVLINGIDLKEIDLPSYLSHVGYVEQEPQILFGTVLDNIRYGNFDATDEEVIAAAKKAQLHNFILGLSEKYDTILGERGFILSGGQKQRLVIARMFLKNPELLILDEATSALDNIVEKEVQSQLDKLIVGRTTIVIAHRLSTIKNCDQIIVLGKDAGGIIEVGTFDELKNSTGHFGKLYKAGLMS
ncbi:ABC transporter ATP-binding protein/permease [Spiroplasma gladiatoris]|uniref:ABC transporter ATP-binding protein/permease n=1 Tax=Spiroplasma gladiatoris TaxID=2143 RepID=A0A4P7AJ21_9MOLU|nr:ABC transporter B family permease/ATP-binding protein [Spiroplasma gladiatoris]QBQ07520.1 ABC transporter ATP-binding protein/permease [Spiroplasma gladiatoris]